MNDIQFQPIIITKTLAVIVDLINLLLKSVIINSAQMTISVNKIFIMINITNTLC